MWQDEIESMLRKFRIHKHILEEVPEPADPTARAQWTEDRYEIDQFIRSTAPDQTVCINLGALGWNARSVNPKKTYEILIEYFTQSTDDEVYNILKECITSKRSNFNSTSAYQNRMVHLKKRLT